MNLEERLNRILIERCLCPAVLPIRSHTAYGTVAEGFQHLGEHLPDEDGIGCFDTETLGLCQIQLPMVVGQFTVEDIQRTKSGNYRVHFRRSESA